MGQCPCLAGSGSGQEQWSRTLFPDSGTGGSDPAGSGGWGHSPLRRGVLMPVLAVAVGAGGRCGEQGGSGEDSEQQALHRVLGSALRVWALCGGCLGCCGGAHGPCGALGGCRWGGVLGQAKCLAYGKNLVLPMDLRQQTRPRRINFLMGTGIYVCLLRKRSVSVALAPLKTLAAQWIYCYVV
jgi:hypothetical protein